MEKKRRRIPLKPIPAASGKPAKEKDPEQDSNADKAADLPEPGELTQTKEEPKWGNIGKNNAGGYE